MKKHANSIDVARRAGVSQTTVSFVLNNRRDHAISPETRQRVLDAAKELRYRSNRLSHGIFRGRTGLIGVIIPPRPDDYYLKLLVGVSDECVRNGSRILLTYPSGSDSGTPDPLQALIEFRVDGVVYIWEEDESSDRVAWLQELVEKEVPCVIVDDRSHADIVDCFVSDDIAESRAAVTGLLKACHRDLAHLSAGNSVSTAADRRQGYIDAMVAAGVEDVTATIRGQSYLPDQGARAAQEILKMIPRPTAIFAANDILAAEMLKAAQRVGLNCPEDFALIGYGNTSIAKALDLTSVDQNPEEIGRQAVKRLIERMADRSLPPITRTMKSRLIERNSTAKSQADRASTELETTDAN
jgi:LacI family transcriptional regulator